MGYTTVRTSPGAVSAAARLAQGASKGVLPQQLCDALGLLVDQVAGEAGVWEPDVCARALLQAQGDVARAVSLVRAWAAMLPRLASTPTALSSMRTVRRITPAFREPDGGQYLGASLDYAQRLLDLDGPGAQPAIANAANGARDKVDVVNGAQRVAAPIAHDVPRALDELERAGRVDPGPTAHALDRTREPVEVGAERGAFAQLLSRAETGTMTALAYTAIRGDGDHPTLAELRVGELAVEVVDPRSGGSVRVGAVPLTVAEMVLYRGHRRGGERRLTLGVGATFGRLERRAIAAALLDANCAAAGDATVGRPPAADEEFLTIALEGQEASGFLEHLKLPHHVTFTSTLDRLQADGVDDGVQPAEDP